KNTIFIKSRSFTDTFGTFIKKKSLHHLIRNYCKILRRKTAFPLLDPNIQEYCFEDKYNFMATKGPPDIICKMLLMKKTAPTLSMSMGNLTLLHVHTPFKKTAS
ncbi:MAG: hypothetical protein ACYSOV_07950, partial [Planctomycetota bacterium]